MALRPVFLSKTSDVKIENINFKWYPGFSVSQKKKSVNSLHSEIEKIYPHYKILEVSSKSGLEVGVKASAFNLSIERGGRKYTVEQLYQASKFYKRKESLLNLLKENLSSKEMKMIANKYDNEDELIKFKFFEKEFPLEPKNYFYNWLYIKCLHENTEIAKEILKYDGFTDIEFNPLKSYSCQAHACAVYKYLYLNDLLEESLENEKNFLKNIQGNEPSKKDNSSETYTQQTFEL